MVKLTAEIVVGASQRINPASDRELDLRGYKIPLIENLGATLNQFDTIDFTDNDIRKVDNFPLLPRLKCLLFNNNRIVRISPSLSETILNLETLILTNNMIQELADVECLIPLKNLRNLSLLFNPVSTKEHYRFYVVHRLPQLKLLDFRKIRPKELEEVKSFFKTSKGKELMMKTIASRKVNIDLDDDDEDVAKTNGTSNQLAGRPIANSKSQEQVAAIRKAIQSATSLEEIERLNQMLKSGQVPQESNSESMDTV